MSNKTRATPDETHTPPLDSDAPGGDAEETTDAPAEDHVRRGAPNDVPDTQEALFAPDGAYRVDENEGEGKRPATAAEVRAETDGLRIVGEDEV